ncbi:hypothetical protein ACFLQV_05200, partial [Calditrichota bacterium]
QRKDEDFKALYMKDWSVQRWQEDHLGIIDLGYHKPFEEIVLPQELPTGRYCLTSGIRQEDGSAQVRMEWFVVKEGKTTDCVLRFE